MNTKDTLLQSFYKNLIKPVKHSINIYDLLLFTALLKNWHTIVQHIIENEAYQKSKAIEISSVKNTVLFIDVVDPQHLFVLSMKTHTIKNVCNTLLQTIDWLALGKSIGLESFDIPNEEFLIKEISFNVKR